MIDIIRTNELRYITGKNGKGIYLKDFDLELLYFLYEQTMVTQTQAHTFHCLFKKIHYNQFRNKIQKLAKLEIIEKKKYHLIKKMGFRLDLIKIGRRGLDILEYLKWIPNKTEGYEVKRFQDHHIGTRQIILEMYKQECLSKGFAWARGGEHMFVFDKKKVRSIDPSIKYEKRIYYYTDPDLGINEPISFREREGGEQTFFQEKPLYSIAPYSDPIYRDKVDQSIIVMPDWTIMIANTYFHIELDTDTEKIKKNNDDSSSKITSLEDKIEKYIELTNHHSDVKHIVLLVTLDDSVTLKGTYGLKTKRIGNLKKFIPSIPKFINSSLDIYIVRLERIKDLLIELLPAARQEKEHRKILRAISNSLTLNRLHFPFEVHMLNDSKSIERVVKDPESLAYSIETLLYFRPRERREENQLFERVYLPVMMFEGNVKSQEELHYFTQKKNEGRFKEGTVILALYPTKCQMQEDVLRPDLNLEHVIFGNVQELLNFKVKPVFYKNDRREEIFIE